MTAAELQSLRDVCVDSAKHIDNCLTIISYSISRVPLFSSHEFHDFSSSSVNFPRLFSWGSETQILCIYFFKWGYEIRLILYGDNWNVLKRYVFPQYSMVAYVVFFQYEKTSQKFPSFHSAIRNPVLGLNHTEPRPEQGSKQYRENRSWFLSWDQCECFLCSSIIWCHWINLCKVPQFFSGIQKSSNLYYFSTFSGNNENPAICTEPRHWTDPRFA